MKRVDDFFKERVNSFEFDFEESYWEGAEKLIIAQEEKKRKKRLAFIWICFTSIILIASTSIYYLTKDKMNADVDAKKNNQTSNIITNSEKNDASTSLSIQSNDEKSNDEKSITVKKEVARKRNKRARQISNSTIEDRISKTEQVQDVEIRTKELDSLEYAYLLKAQIMKTKSIYEIFEQPVYADEMKQRKRGGLLLQLGLTESIKLNYGAFANIQWVLDLNRRQSISLGLGTKMLSNDYMQYQYSIVDYSFGEELSTTTVLTDRLYLLELPIQYRYRIYRQHSIMLSMSANYLLAQRNVLTTENNDGSILVQKETGKSDDFNDFNFQAAIGYETTVLNRYRLGLSYQQGFGNIVKSDDKIILSGNRLNTEFRVYLLMSLFR